ncbi:MAG TPA: M64 family metallopeptidase, partial [Vicinamibacterales bacterium]|nr:M64 family metallopeptidase [Vicinamibacterales bacterium]
REQRQFEEKFLAAMKHGKAVGAFEGAGYEAKGLYRPQADCIMFTRDPVGFCAVCRRAIARIIDLYSR